MKLITSALVISFSIGSLFGTSAFAKRPEGTASASSFSFLSDSVLKKVGEHKNAKGESTSTQSTLPGLWSTLDPTLDKTQGTSTEKIYQTLTVPTDAAHEVIVAVIDSGVDITHEDLKGKIWINEAELNGKPGVDDDHDGYIDDIYGWNFLGAADGTNVGKTTLECTREVARLTKIQTTRSLTAAETAELAKAQAVYDEQTTHYQQYYQVGLQVVNAFKLLHQNGLKVDTLDGLSAVTSTDPAVVQAKAIATRIFQQGFTLADYQDAYDQGLSAKDFYLNLKFDSSSITGDHPDQLAEKGYGNGNVTGPDAMHGTHVAGIIAADRFNNLGILGQATDVKIMVLRAVPDGDERDKDIANAIFYAVDHGASVINMSFGKPFSPNKAYVDSAMMYAAKHGVVVVHAAGNENANNDSYDSNFPNDHTLLGSVISSWIEVGASSRDNSKMTLAAEFSNYGKASIDVFAPGVDIISTVPGNQYKSLQGTSMASPEVAGVAALLKSKYMNATADEIKDAITKTVNQYANVMVKLPNENGKNPDENVLFSSLSKSGGTVNAFEAMKYLSAQQAQKNQKPSTFQQVMGLFSPSDTDTSTATF
jgi:cell wall-associated protease